MPKINSANRKIKEKSLKEGWKEVKEVLHIQELLYMLKIIFIELICRHHNNPLASHFDIEKTWESVAQKYYWPIL